MTDSRQQAHLALRPLWEAADTRLRTAQDAVAGTLPSGNTITSCQTDRGATITMLGDLLMVDAEFTKPDGTDEAVRVMFPEDIRDLSETIVEVDWNNRDGSGTNTPPRSRYPQLARELLDLM
jgi:hypothetical protein